VTAHPRHCHTCNGTGWMPGPPTPAGNPTVTQCTHPWWHDDPHPEQFPWSDPHAQAAYARGYIAGVAELDTIHRTGTDPENQDA